MKKLTVAAIAIGVASIAAILMMADVQFRYADRISTSVNDAPHADAAMVLGASIKPDGSPSDALRDRLLTGVALYHLHTVDRILLTGDDGEYHADELDVMQKFLHGFDIPDTDIQVDGKGFRTYESCKHAHEEGIQSILIVTQRFHIARALYLCNQLGVDSHGVTSDLEHYKDITFFWGRDLLASVKAWWDIHVQPPQPPV